MTEDKCFTLKNKCVDVMFLSADKDKNDKKKNKNSIFIFACTTAETFWCENWNRFSSCLFD